MPGARWTKQRPYRIAIQQEVTGDWNGYGPFDFRAAANYAAKVIRENLKDDKQPSLAVYHFSAMVVEVLGGNSIKPSPHYRARIADADIDDTVDSQTRGEHHYILAACRDAGANGTPP